MKIILKNNNSDNGNSTSGGVVIYENKFNTCKQVMKCAPVQWMERSDGKITAINKFTIEVSDSGKIAPVIKREWIGEQVDVHLDTRLQENIPQTESTYHPSQDGSILQEEGTVSYRPIICCCIKSFTMNQENLETKWTIELEQA